MAGRIALDLKKFKHIGSTPDTTTLKHQDGHLLTVAHSGLSPEGQKQLSALSNVSKDIATPLQATEARDQKMADGGKIPPKPSSGTLDYKALQREHREKGRTPPPAGGELNYSTFPKETQAKNEAFAAEERAKPKKMADGGDVDPNGPGMPDWGMKSYPTPDGSAPGEISPPDYPPTNGTPDIAANVVPNLSAPPEQALAAPPQPQQPASAQAAMPSQPETNDGEEGEEVAAAPQPKAPSTPQEVKQGIFDHLMTEDDAWNKDLQNGHIQPETINSLFAKKDTIGKISTIFGLMLGGIGSGLTKQPNALLEMMNNQIKNDLEAQKTSKENAQNFLKINMQHQINQGQLAQWVRQGKLTEAEAKNVTQEAALKAYSLSNMQMNRKALHSLSTDVDKMPPGSPQRQKAEQVLAMLNQGVQNDNYQLADRAATAGANLRFLTGTDQTNPGQSNEQTFQTQQNVKRMLGPQGEMMAKNAEDKHIPGVTGMASKAVPDEDRNQIQAMNVLDAKGKDVLQYIQAHKGTLRPNELATASQKIEEMKNFYNDSIKGGALTEGRLGWYDEQFGKSNPTGRLHQFFGGKSKLEEMVNSNATRRDLLLKKNGFPTQPNAQQPNNSQYPSSITRGGKPMTLQMINGKPFYVPSKGD